MDGEIYAPFVRGNIYELRKVKAYSSFEDCDSFLTFAL